MRYLTITCLSLGLLALAGCSSADAPGESDAGSGGGGEECPDGQILRGGVCVDRGTTTDTGPNPTDTGTTDTAVDAGFDVPETCTPGESICVGPTRVGVCDATGSNYEEVDCSPGEVCEGGSCIPETTSCTPGEVLRCATREAQLVCAANGVDTETRPCPAETPFCDGGECTDQLCSPGSRSCEGGNVVECNEDGTGTSVVETCDAGCSGGVCSDPCAGDGKTYVGCAFYAVDLDNFAISCTSSADCGLGETCTGGLCEPSAASQQFAVTVSNAGGSRIDVSVTDGGGSTVSEVSIEPGQLQSIPLPRADVNDSSLSFNSFRVDSTGPVTVHQFNPQNNADVFSNDASLLLPAPSLGTEYIVMGWPTVSSGTVSLKSFVTIVAVAEGETEVSISSPTATAAGPGGTPAAISAGGTRSFTLQQGQVLSLTTLGAQGADLTGMEIISNGKPIAVFSGAECANVPLDNTYCDHLEQQLLPVDTWGLDFVGSKFADRGTEPDVWRIMASEDGTTVRTSPRITGVDGTVLNRGQFVEFETTDDFFVGATAPISVGQFMVGSSYPGPDNGCDRGSLFGDTSRCAIPPTCDTGSGIGDPAFLMSVPVDQFREDYIVLTPNAYEEDYLTVVGEPGTTVNLDGNPLGAHDGSVGGYNIWRVPVADGIHRVDASGPIGLYAYGYDCDVSYAYPGGLDLDSLR